MAWVHSWPRNSVCHRWPKKKRKEIVKSILVDLVYVSVAKMNKVYFVLEDSCVLTIPENYWI